jgi:O-antigen ligase
VKHRQNVKKLDKSSNSVWFMLFGVSAVTLFFKVDFYDPFNSPKLILLLLVAGWLLGHLLNSYRLQPVTAFSKEFTVTTLTLGFVISLLVALMQSDQFLVGLIGETQRRNGFLSYFGLSVIFLFTLRHINFSNVIRVYQIGILTGVVLSMYGLFQISGNDFVTWDNPYNSMISTLGNPNFASATLAILFLIGLFGLLLRGISSFFKILIGFLLVMALIAIIISNSRQGLLVIFFSCIFYTSVYSIIKNRKLGFLVTGLSSIAVTLATLGMLQKGPLTPILYKDSVSIRGYYWRAGIEMFKDSPLNGIGVDRYGNAFKLFREVGYPLKYGFEITSSNAHNTIVQLFATSGLFVGIFYLAILIYIFFSGINLLKRCEKDQKNIVLGLLAAWVGFQAQSLISIDNIGVSVWGWLLGGSILGLSFRGESTINQTDNQKIKRTVQISLFQPVISVFVLVPIMTFASSLYKAERDMYVLKGISNPEYPQNKPVVQTYVDKVLSNSTADPFYQYRTAFFLYDMGYQDKAYLTVSNALASDPTNPEFLRGMIFLEESRNNFENVISLRKKISAVDPWNADNYLQLLKLYKAAGDTVGMEAMRTKILSFAENTDVAKSVLEIIG